MNLLELAHKARSIRRFDAARPLDLATLRQVLEPARLAASPGNLQPLRYRLVAAPEECALVFPHLRWARYLKDWQGPAPQEVPTGYLAILGDPQSAKSFDLDLGLVCSLISLSAAEQGLGACVIMAMEKRAISAALRLPQALELLAVVALGWPQETVILETAQKGEIKYWRDEAGRHHVPKRPWEELILPPPQA